MTEGRHESVLRRLDMAIEHGDAAIKAATWIPWFMIAGVILGPAILFGLLYFFPELR